MAIIINGRGRVGARVTSGGSSGGGTDVDAQAFITAASITDSTQISAVNTLVTGLKSAGIWSKMKAIYPVVGGNATAHSKNLINPSLYNLTFSSGWVHSSTGAKPNGINAYADTSFNTSTNMSRTDGYIGAYSRTTALGIYALFGNKLGPNNLYMYPCFSSGNGYASYGGEAGFSADVITKGLYSIGRLSTQDANLKVIKNSSTILYNGNPSSMQIPNSSLYLGATNDNGSITAYAPYEISLFYISLGLTTSEISNLYTLVQAFQTTLGRQV